MYELTDADIKAAIAQHDDPDHADACTVSEVREALDAINDDVTAHWDLYQDAIDDGAHEIVYEDSDVVVLADHSGHLWREQLDAMEIADDALRTIVTSLHHTAARKHCEYSWSTADPFVLVKSGAFQAGEQQVLREIARRTEKFGSVARAVDTLATETHGFQKSTWATLTDRNPSTVSRMTDN